MGHYIRLINPKTEELITYCFPLVGEGTVEASMVNGVLKALPFQSSLSITYNNHQMWYLGMRNIGHPVDSLGDWLNGAIAKDVYPILIKLAEELESKPEVYKPLESKNGWGSYSTFCKQVRVLASACIVYPDAVICDL
jgi:hypothetical protein